MDNKRIFTPEQLHYLRLLSKQYPTVQSAGVKFTQLKTNLESITLNFIPEEERK